jgi:hypothetical protein
MTAAQPHIPPSPKGACSVSHHPFKYPRKRLKTRDRNKLTGQPIRDPNRQVYTPGHDDSYLLLTGFREVKAYLDLLCSPGASKRM